MCFESLTTYGQFKEQWHDTRWEIIDAKYYKMPPITYEHQQVLLNMLTQLRNNLKETEWKILMMPYKVLLRESNEEADSVKNVVLPDIILVSDIKKIKEEYCYGSPDIIVEVVDDYESTPSWQLSHEYITKLALYQKFKIKEYWIVDIGFKRVMSYDMHGKDTYGSPNIFNGKEFGSYLLMNCNINLKNLFDSID